MSSDYQKAKDFYVDKLGFKVKREVERKDRDDFIITLEAPNGILIELFIEKNPPRRVTRPEAAGLRHLAFRVQDIEESVEKLNKKGIETEEIRIDPQNGKRMTFFMDPDGLPLELHE
ncbi:MAG: VOC family protein [Spirochaetales bacterium]|nr:VOC family protein [Spirochaetales bacterium]